MSPSSIRNRLETVFALAHLLQGVEAGAVGASAEGYRLLVSQLQSALGQEMPTDALRAILRAHPAAAEVYENLHYAHAGLSLASLELSVTTEQAARQELARIAAL